MTAMANQCGVSVCPRCLGPWCCVRRGNVLIVSCPGGCTWRRVRSDGIAAGGAWAAVAGAGDQLTVLAVGPERVCWDELLRSRRGGQMALVAPLARNRDEGGRRASA